MANETTLHREKGSLDNGTLIRKILHDIVRDDLWIKYRNVYIFHLHDTNISKMEN